AYTSINSFTHAVGSTRTCRSQLFEHKATSPKKPKLRTTLPIFLAHSQRTARFQRPRKSIEPGERWPCRAVPRCRVRSGGKGSETDPSNLPRRCSPFAEKYPRALNRPLLWATPNEPVPRVRFFTCPGSSQRKIWGLQASSATLRVCLWRKRRDRRALSQRVVGI